VEILGNFTEFFEENFVVFWIENEVLNESECVESNASESLTISIPRIFLRIHNLRFVLLVFQKKIFSRSSIKASSIKIIKLSIMKITVKIPVVTT
jgi:hypothetical protein